MLSGDGPTGSLVGFWFRGRRRGCKASLRGACPRSCVSSLLGPPQPWAQVAGPSRFPGSLCSCTVVRAGLEGRCLPGARYEHLLEWRLWPERLRVSLPQPPERKSPFRCF